MIVILADEIAVSRTRNVPREMSSHWGHLGALGREQSS